VFLNIT